MSGPGEAAEATAAPASQAITVRPAVTSSRSAKERRRARTPRSAPELLTALTTVRSPPTQRAVMCHQDVGDGTCLAFRRRSARPLAVNHPERRTAAAIRVRFFGSNSLPAQWVGNTATRRVRCGHLVFPMPRPKRIRSGRRVSVTRHVGPKRSQSVVPAHPFGRTHVDPEVGLSAQADADAGKPEKSSATATRVRHSIRHAPSEQASKENPIGLLSCVECPDSTVLIGSV